MRTRTLLPLFALLAHCAPEGGSTATVTAAADFADPAMQRAASFVASGDAATAIAAARAGQGGIDAIDRKGVTLLALAVGRNDVASVNALIAAGANPSHPAGRAPIALAVELADIRVVAALLDAKADPNGTANEESALWRAAMTGQRDVAELLLKHGAAIDFGDSDGITPALAAVKSSQFSVALFLVERGANPAARSRDGTTMAAWAARSRIDPGNREGQAREQLYARMRQVGAM